MRGISFMFGLCLLFISTTMPVGCSVAHVKYPHLFGDPSRDFTGLAASTLLLTILTIALGLLAIQESLKDK